MIFILNNFIYFFNDKKLLAISILLFTFFNKISLYIYNISVTCFSCHFLNCHLGDGLTFLRQPRSSRSLVRIFFTVSFIAVGAYRIEPTWYGRRCRSKSSNNLSASSRVPCRGNARQVNRSVKTWKESFISLYIHSPFATLRSNDSLHSNYK